MEHPVSPKNPLSEFPYSFPEDLTDTRLPSSPALKTLPLESAFPSNATGPYMNNLEFLPRPDLRNLLFIDPALPFTEDYPSTPSAPNMEVPPLPHLTPI